jgi:hypothetical protein
MDMREEIRAAFRDQAEACRRMGSPFNGLICDLLGERLSPESRFGELIDAWQGHPAADALALRAAGALHALARSGRVPALTAHYARPEQPDPDALWQVIAGALQDHADMLCAYLDGPPQTNEVGRSAVLLGAALHVSARTHLPLCWYEIGASAGLNLRFDRYRYELGAAGFWGQAASWAIRSNWEGELPSLAQAFTIAERAGCDLQPLDPSLAEHRERLLSYIWPDQTERLERTTAALDTAARGGTRVVCEPASTWVAQRFGAAPKPGRARVLVHTVVWQYLARGERDAVKRAMHSAGASATAQTPVAWFSMEADGSSDSAALRLTVWPGGERHALGRADFHGRWVRWS